MNPNLPIQKIKTTPYFGTTDTTKTLVDVLLSQGNLTEDKAKQVKLSEIQTGKAQEDIISAQRLVSESALTKAKAELFNIPYIDLTSIPVSTETLSLLPQ